MGEQFVIGVHTPLDLPRCSGSAHVWPVDCVEKLRHMVRKPSESRGSQHPRLGRGNSDHRVNLPSFELPEFYFV